MKKKYWQSLDELKNGYKDNASTENNFPTLSDLISSNITRRDFLKMAGFGVGLLVTNSCETPVQKIAQFFQYPGYRPGVPIYLISAFYDYFDYAPIIAKIYDGRPIFLSANTNNALGIIGLNARILASLLYCYDSKRNYGIRDIGINSYNAKFNEYIAKLKAMLQQSAAENKKNYLITHEIISPTLRKLLEEFSKKYNVRIVEYSSLPWNHISDVWREFAGLEGIPLPNIRNCNVVVGIDADFLMTYPLSLKIASDYSFRRDVSNGDIIKHFQIESTLTTTGILADERLAVKPSEKLLVLGLIYNKLLSGRSELFYPLIPENLLENVGKREDIMKFVDKVVDAIRNNYERSLFICGGFDFNEQLLTALINRICGAFNQTLNLQTPILYARKGLSNLEEILAEISANHTGVVLFYNCNPVFHLPDYPWKDFFATNKDSIYFGWQNNETSQMCSLSFGTTYCLEEWNDYEVVRGIYHFAQPLLAPFFDVASFSDIICNLLEIGTGYKEFLWNEISKRTGLSPQEIYQKGEFIQTETSKNFSYELKKESWEKLLEAIRISSSNNYPWEVSVAIHPHLYDGIHFENPFLRELPEPVTRITWDAYTVMNPQDMQNMQLNTLAGQLKKFDKIKVSFSGKDYEFPAAVPLPGQKKGVITIFTGYKKSTLRSQFETNSINAYSILNILQKRLPPIIEKIEKTGESIPIAFYQTWHTPEGRDPAKQISFSKFKKDYSSAPPRKIEEEETIRDGYGNSKTPDKVGIWKEHKKGTTHQWKMTIDLSRCIGCGACVIACIEENNIPIVGKTEVLKNRDLHWIRIDRYFYNSDEKFENVRGIFQPLMCQHCNNAPCETVCPVLATTGSIEGINMMAYNRCVGTRYCANNCPYKVRRFNWWNYPTDKQFKDVNPAQDEQERFILNPEVTVRERGVMEKCSFCIQRIQSKKLQAKMEKRTLRDGEVVPACAQVCPTKAITFGDYNDSSSEVKKKYESPIAYSLLAELGTRPNVAYIARIVNVEESPT